MDDEIKARIIEIMGHLPIADQGAHVINQLNKGYVWVVTTRGKAITGMLYAPTPYLKLALPSWMGFPK